MKKKAKKLQEEIRFQQITGLLSQSIDSCSIGLIMGLDTHGRVWVCVDQEEGSWRQIKNPTVDYSPASCGGPPPPLRF